MVAKKTAAVPRIVVIISPEPEDNNAPTRVIPEIAFAPDINGVCNVEGTLVINSIPKKIANTNINNNKICPSMSYILSLTIELTTSPSLVMTQPFRISSDKSKLNSLLAASQYSSIMLKTFDP